MRRFFFAVAVTSLFVSGMPAPSLALQCSGLTLFGGPQREYELKYCMQSGREDTWDRYFLKIPKDKVDVAISELRIQYPEHYRGEFNEEKIELKVNDNTVELQEAFWDRDNRFLQIYPVEAIPANSDVEVVLSQVRNPNRGGMFNFNCLAITRGGPPLPEYIGTWVLTID